MRLIVVLVLLAIPRVAAAYPQFQLVFEERCSDCHLAPTGGGLLNFYGRAESATTISRGGDGGFLEGAWDPPEWFAIGGEARFAAARHHVKGDGHTLFFPMQSELYLRAMKDSFAVVVTAGLRGAAREPEPTYFERLASREHYVSYEGEELFIRVGRFLPVFGLRLPDHTAYVRRHLGLYLQEEPYAIGISHFAEKTETHVSAFVRQPSAVLGAGYQPSGVTALVEHRFDSAHIYGAQTRVAVSDEESRMLIGGIAKWRVDSRLLVLAELDVQRQWFRRPSAGSGRMQVAGYLGVTKWLTKGVLLTPAVHVWDPDVMLEGSRREAVDLHLQYFPRAHLELHMILRATVQGDENDDGYLALLQGHYYL